MPNKIHNIAEISVFILLLTSCINSTAAPNKTRTVKCKQEIPGIQKQTFNIGSGVKALTYSLDGNLVILTRKTQENTNDLYLINTSENDSSCSKIHSIPLSDSIEFITSGPEGIFFVSNWGRYIKLFDITNKAFIDSKILTDNIYENTCCNGISNIRALALSPDKKSLATATSKGYIYLKNNNKNLERLYRGLYCGTISAIVFSPDSEFIVSATRKVCSQDHSNITFWSVKSGLAQKRVQLNHIKISLTGAMAISPDCRIVAISNGYKDAAGDILELRDTNTGLCFHKFEIPESLNYIEAIAFSPSGNEIAVGTHNGTVIVLTDTVWKDAVFALACAQHPRPGAKSPAQALSSGILQEIYEKAIPTPWTWLSDTIE